MKRRVSSARVLVVEDHVLVAECVMTLLKTLTGVVPVGTVTTVRAAIQAVGRLQPDLIILDLSLPDGSGLDVCPAIHRFRPDMRVLILSAEHSTATVRRAIEMGVDGYVLKGSPVSTLVEAIRCLRRGERFLDPSMSGCDVWWGRVIIE